MFCFVSTLGGVTVIVMMFTVWVGSQGHKPKVLIFDSLEMRLTNELKECSFNWDCITGVSHSDLTEIQIVFLQLCDPLICINYKL